MARQLDGLRTDSTRWMTGPGDSQSRFRNSAAAVSENNAHRRFFWGLLPWQPHFRVSRSFLPPLFLPRALRLMGWYFSRAILGPGPWMKIQPRKYGRELRMQDLYIELRHRPPAISTHALQAASPHTNRPRKNPWGSLGGLCPPQTSRTPGELPHDFRGAPRVSEDPVPDANVFYVLFYKCFRFRKNL